MSIILFIPEKGLCLISNLQLDELSIYSQYIWWLSNDKHNYWELHYPLMALFTWDKNVCINIQQCCPWLIICDARIVWQLLIWENILMTVTVTLWIWLCESTQSMGWILLKISTCARGGAIFTHAGLCLTSSQLFLGSPIQGSRISVGAWAAGTKGIHRYHTTMDGSLVSGCHHMHTLIQFHHFSLPDLKCAIRHEHLQNTTSLWPSCDNPQFELDFLEPPKAWYFTSWYWISFCCSCHLIQSHST